MPPGNLDRVFPCGADGEKEARLAQQPALVEGPVDGALADAAAALLGRGGDPLVSPGGGDDFLGGPYGDADRLLAEDVDAAGKQPAGQDVVEAVRAADIGPVQFFSPSRSWPTFL